MICSQLQSFRATVPKGAGRGGFGRNSYLACTNNGTDKTRPVWAAVHCSGTTKHMISYCVRVHKSESVDIAPSCNTITVTAST